MEIREFLERELRPIADDYWDRAEFPMHLIPEVGRLGMLGPVWPETKRFENTALYRGWVALELARVDPGFATFVGVQNGLTMGAIGVGGSPEQRAEWLPPMATRRGHRRLRAHRAAVRLRHRPRPAHDRAPHGRHLGAQRRQALDRERHVRGRRRHLGARHRRRPGQGLPRPPRHPRVHRDEDRAQAGAAHRAERRHPARRRGRATRRTGCRTSTRSRTSRSCCG